MKTARAKTASRAWLFHELERIASKSGKPEKFDIARLFIESIFDKKTPSHALNFDAAAKATARPVSHVPMAELDAYLAMWEHAHGILRERGYRENILTYQEHRLTGSSRPDETISDPHVPLGLLGGELSLAETRRARMLVAWVDVMSGFYVSDETVVSVALEPLDRSGRTLRDPRRVDGLLFDSMLFGNTFSVALARAEYPFVKSPDFPFRRD